ncbi:MAG: hypothetical protein KME55_29445 [Nostoc indistinguendum CM1-VF10]|jgi:hypothetical protein|nr:hypothetical protein [Nostoc indistinguendum CM1-VF10]
MNSLHIRRNFLKLVKRVGLFGFSALGVGTTVGLSTTQSAQSKQTSDSKQIQDLAERVKTLEAQLPLDKVVEISQNSPSSNDQNNKSQVRIGDTLICAGTAPMIIPQGGAHVRQVEIRLPKFSPKPTVTATIYSTESPGNVFGIFSIKINDLGNQTQIGITATNVERGFAVPYAYFCNYIVIGKSPQS